METKKETGNANAANVADFAVIVADALKRVHTRRLTKRLENWISFLSSAAVRGNVDVRPIREIRDAFARIVRDRSWEKGGDTDSDD